MISNIKCEICLQNFSEFTPPRVCNRCGNSICQKCLNGIYQKQNNYICPYCKGQNDSMWAKNITILNMMDEEKGANLCLTHKRRAMSFCSSPTCTLPPAICDLAECSKMHKERGTNNIPMSLILESPDMEMNRQMIGKAIENFYQEVEKAIISEIALRKQHVLKKASQGNVQESCFKTESQIIVNKMKKCDLKGITSEMLSKIKAELLEEEEHQEVNLKSKVEQILSVEKKELSEKLDSKIKSTDINFMKIFEAVKAHNIKNQMEVEEEPEDEKREIPSKKIIIHEQSPDSIKNPNDPIERFLVAPKNTSQYQLIYEVTKKRFKPELIFSAGRHPTTMFKSTLAGKPNLFVRIQLADGKIIGCFFKKPYAAKFNTETFFTDSDAFVYWLDASRVFKASKNSVSQYDVSPDYLFSVGNTYKWDGFWFPKDFSKINPDHKSNEIKSQQYTDLLIPIPNRTVVRFEVFVLNFV